MNNEIFLIIKLAFLNYYLIMLLVYEWGPFGIFEKLRFFAGINSPVLDIDGNIVEFEANGSTFSKIFSCHRCMGFWSGIILSAGFGLNIFSATAVVGLSVFMHELTKRSE